MRMLVFSICASAHTAAAITVTALAPAALRGADPGGILLWSVAAVAVLMGLRGALAVHLAVLAEVLAHIGFRTRALRDLALRLAPLALRGALSAAVAGGLGLAAVTGTAHAAPPGSPLPWPLTSPSAPAEPAEPEQGEAGPEDAEHAQPAEDTGVEDGTEDAPRTPAHHIVRAGESLWSIAAEANPGAAPARLAGAVADLHERNRTVIGADPSLILPGQRLELP